VRRPVPARRGATGAGPDELHARRRGRGAWMLAMLALAGAGVALAEGGAPRALIRADALVLAALVAYVAVRRLAPPKRRRSRRGPARPELPHRVERLERRVAVAVGSALDAHTGVRPVLREIAGERLARRGIALDADPDAPGLLGDELWELVRPDRPVPDRVDPHGLPLRELRRHLDTLEAL
jgi:hypothetical protein